MRADNNSRLLSRARRERFGAISSTPEIACLPANNKSDVGEFEHMIRHQLSIGHTCECRFCTDKKASEEAAEKAAAVIRTLPEARACAYYSRAFMYAPPSFDCASFDLRISFLFPLLPWPWLFYLSYSCKADASKFHAHGTHAHTNAHTRAGRGSRRGCQEEKVSNERGAEVVILKRWEALGHCIPLRNKGHDNSGMRFPSDSGTA